MDGRSFRTDMICPSRLSPVGRLRSAPLRFTRAGENVGAGASVSYRRAAHFAALPAGELTLAQIGARTGYASPYAFAAAFRRHHGLPPGQWRQRQTTSPQATQTAADGNHG